MGKWVNGLLEGLVLEELASGGKVGWRRPLLIWCRIISPCIWRWRDTARKVFGMDSIANFGLRRRAEGCEGLFENNWSLLLLNLAFVCSLTDCTIIGHRFGRYHHGLRIGWWWEGGEHRGGWLGGRPGHLEVLLLSRHLCWLFVFEQVFIYPDMKTAISGTFSEDGRLVAGSECEVDLEEKTCWVLLPFRCWLQPMNKASSFLSSARLLAPPFTMRSWHHGTWRGNRWCPTPMNAGGARCPSCPPPLWFTSPPTSI